VSTLGTLWARLGQRDEISARLEGLEAAVAAARGRLDPHLVEEAAAVVARAGDRLKLSPEHTVVAISGATGSGKSSLFNLLCGLDLAAVGVKRPTTSWALACSWGDGAEDLLEWLGVPPRHQVNRASSLDVSEPQRDLQGLVLLDLPDHDSTEVSHHLEVDRLVGLADVLVWVLDPQKYADATIHDRFLRPMASHRDVMLAVFNHVDELGADAAAQTVADARRLLVADGLDGVPLIATSATRGDGMAELRAEIVRRVDQKRSARARVSADIETVARRLSAATGSAEPESLGAVARDELVNACADAAGVPLVVSAVEESLRVRSRQTTGWPLSRWLSRLRADPLRRLNLGSVGGPGAGRHAAVARASLPHATPVQRARVGTAARGTGDAVSRGLPPAWEAATHAASVARVDEVTDALDAAVSGTDLAAARAPRWWSAVRVLQWLLLVGAVVGAGWLAALAGISHLGVPRPADPRWLSILVPAWMLVGGLVLGFVVAAPCGWAGRFSARRRAKRAAASLRASVGQVVEELVVGPVEAEVAAYRACRDGLALALPA
jgi:GTP-binding protein EngB required for normal cell division